MIERNAERFTKFIYERENTAALSEEETVED